MKYGNPYQKISGTIAEEEADYIIMGSKGASGLREVFIGSNAERNGAAMQNVLFL